MAELTDSERMTSEQPAPEETPEMELNGLDAIRGLDTPSSEDDAGGDAEVSTDESKTEPTQTVDDHSDDTGARTERLERLRELGLSEKLADALVGDDEVDTFLDQLDRKLEGAERSVPGESPASTPAEAKAPEPNQPADEDIDLDPDLYDENVVSVVRSLKKQIADLKTQNASQSVVTERLAKLEALENERQFDHSISSLGDEFKPILGDLRQPTTDLGSRTKAYRNRKALRDEMEVIEAGNSAKGRSMSHAEVFKRAMAAAFSDDQHKIAGERLRAEVEKSRRSTIARPTSRRGSSDPTDPFEKAVSKERQRRLDRAG